MELSAAITLGRAGACSRVLRQEGLAPLADVEHDCPGFAVSMISYATRELVKTIPARDGPKYLLAGRIGP